MINPIFTNNPQNQANKPSFRAITPVKSLIINNEITTDPKKIKSTLNHFVDILLKLDLEELKNPDKKATNEKIRANFKENVSDYYIPSQYGKSSKKIGDYGQKIRILEDRNSGDFFILTKNEAKILDEAGLKIKNTNSIEEYSKREYQKNLALKNYGQKIRELLSKVDFKSPKLTIYGEKAKNSTKINPIEINLN